MSLNALNTATAGLQVTQAAIGVVSQNVANANSAGYVRRGLSTIANPGGNSGVASGTVSRALDVAAQRQLRLETAGAAYTGQMAQATKQLDTLYGTPGSSTALDGVLNTFTQSLQALSASPNSAAARASVVSNAAAIAARIGSAADGVQSLRTGAESQIGSDVSAASQLLTSIAQINVKIQSTSDDASRADLFDQRDQQITELSQYIDVETAQDTNGTVSVRTGSGVLLVDQGSAATLSFDGRGTLSANNTYSTDATQRGVGTITATTPGGGKIDLVATGAIRSGSIAAGLELRDEVLPKAQRQLDDLAAGLSRSLSDRQAVGTTSGSGLGIDLTGLQAGNAVTVTTTKGGATKTFILVPTTGNAPNPIDPALTNDPNATVKTIDIRSVADIAAKVGAALGSDFTVSGSLGSLVVQPNAAGVAVTGLSAGVTVPTSASNTQTGSPQFALFVDGADSGAAYTGSFEGGSHLTGLAQRLKVNPTVVGNNSAVVSYAAGTLSGDTTRPDFLTSALTSQKLTFSAASGIGGVDAPYTTSVQDFAQQVISAQGATAAQAQQLDDGQKIALQTAQSRYSTASGVNIDTEMSNLIALQTAYSANARVLSAAKDMLDTLLRI